MKSLSILTENHSRAGRLLHAFLLRLFHPLQRRARHGLFRGALGLFNPASGSIKRSCAQNAFAACVRRVARSIQPEHDARIGRPGERRSSRVKTQTPQGCEREKPEMPKPVLLTVDDDPEVLRSIERDLRKRYADRYRVLRADSGATAIRSLETLKRRHEAVALLLADQRMPEMSGVDFIGRAIGLYPEAK